MEKTTPLEKDKVLEKIDNGELTIKGKKKKSIAEKAIENAEKAHKVVQDDVQPKPIEEGVPEKPKRKAKPKTETPKEVFPADGKINKYGFLHFSKQIYEALGWTQHEDLTVRITRTANGIAVERA